jgi:hypothetical protein
MGSKVALMGRREKQEKEPGAYNRESKGERS